MNAGHLARLRRDALAIYEAGVAAVNGHKCVLNACAELDHGSVAAVSIGKAAGSMLAGAQEAFGERLTRGLLISTDEYLDERPSAHVETVLSSHPLPDESSLRAGTRLIDFLATVPHDHALLFLISGGTSAMVESLPAGVGYKDLTRLNRWLLGSGLAINEVNVVRSAVSAIKGGRLRRFLPASVPCYLLAMSDVPDDRPETIGSGLLHPQRKGLPTELPDWVSALCQSPAPEPAAAIPTRIVATPLDALRAASAKAGLLGYPVFAMQRDLYGEVEAVARRLCLNEGPGVSLHAGETTVRLPVTPGRGGRCQHLALIIARAIANRANQVYLCAGTDGCDGMGAAGAIVDGETLSRAEASGLDAIEALNQADSGQFLDSAGVLLPVRKTGTNVTDLVVRIMESERDTDHCTDASALHNGGYSRSQMSFSTMTEFSGGDDPILKALLPGYLARRREELATLNVALERGDFATLRTIGHNLLGSGGAYGLAKVSEFGRAIETAAIADDADAIRATIQQMQAFLEELSI